MSKRYIGIHIVYMRMSENIVANIFRGIILYTLRYQTTFFLFGYVNLWIFQNDITIINYNGFVHVCHLQLFIFRYISHYSYKLYKYIILK